MGSQQVRVRVTMLLAGTVLLPAGSSSAFQLPPMATRSGGGPMTTARTRRQTHRLNGWLGELWEEMIEVATYGPSERRILAERRKRAAAEEAAAENEAGKSARASQGGNNKEEAFMSFAEARKRFEVNRDDNADDDISDDDMSPAAFRKAAAAALAADDGAAQSSPLDGFDGYALRDLLLDKWGAPLDVDFQRDATLNQVYCTVLPIAFGQRLKCRHETELDYLMHLQGIVEVLRKYEQLEDFVAFVEGTRRAPKAGTDSVPYRLNLNEEQKRRIL